MLDYKPASVCYFYNTFKDCVVVSGARLYLDTALFKEKLENVSLLASVPVKSASFYEKSLDGMDGAKTKGKVFLAKGKTLSDLAADFYSNNFDKKSGKICSDDLQWMINSLKFDIGEGGENDTPEHMLKFWKTLEVRDPSEQVGRGVNYASEADDIWAEIQDKYVDNNNPTTITLLQALEFVKDKYKNHAPVLVIAARKICTQLAVQSKGKINSETLAKRLVELECYFM